MVGNRNGSFSSRARRATAATVATVVGLAGLVGVDLATAPGAGAAPISLGVTRASVGASGGELTGGTCSDYGDTSDTKDCAPAISADGLHVAFVTSEAIAPEDRNYGGNDVYVRDLASGETHLVSIGDTGQQGYRASDPSISATGRYVTFTALGSVIPGIAGSDGCDGIEVYVRDRDTDGNGVFDEPGRTATRLVSALAASGSTSSFPADGCATGHSSISSTGRYVAFVSDSASFNGPNIEGFYFTEAWLRDRDTDGNGIFDEPGGVSTIIVSVDGFGNAAEVDPSCGYTTFAVDVTACGPRVSDDGRFVSFMTATAIDETDGNGAVDLVIWDRTTGLSKPAARTGGLTLANGTREIGRAHV